MKIEITCRFSAKVLFEHDAEINTIKITLEVALKSGAYLEGANLRGANLEGANLRGAYLRGANLEGANLRGANLRGAYLRGANLEGANLRGAYLRGAYLEGANLEGAYLRGADLEGAYLEGEKLSQTPLQINGLKWFVLISDNFMRIGCQRFTHCDWANFEDDEIAKMDFAALKFWRQWKSSLIEMCKAHKSNVK